jgi:hypothetical protein
MVIISWPMSSAYISSIIWSRNVYLREHLIFVIEPQIKGGGELRCSGMVSCSTSISGDRPVTLYIARYQVMTSNNGTSTKIKRTKIRANQAWRNTSNDTSSIALISITTTGPSEPFMFKVNYRSFCSNHISDVIVSLLLSSAVDHGLQPRSGQTKDYTIGICCCYARSITIGSLGILPMTNVHAWVQCHSYTEVIKGPCLKDI